MKPNTTTTRNAAFVSAVAGALALIGTCAFAPATSKTNPRGTSAPAASAITWKRLDAGFEVAEMPVTGQGREAERMLLARIDPARFRFVLRNAPAGHTLDEWMRELGAVMVINGSFFAVDGKPDTPILSEGVLLGPQDYDARHGAFVASPRFSGVRDLRKESWRQAFAGADNAMVSFPLLLGTDGGNSVQPSDRRASRSFVGQDRSGRVIFGTTRGASFALDRLAAFLKASPLQLDLALNLDGGPYACQAIAFKGYERNLCGEPNDGGQGARGEHSSRRLPIALGVLPR
ncbi:MULTISPECIES: phosphodiester glycosidase family protein [Rhodomicrobium]|uniref:phosphodiester glycosidase family protein n=1 Tax=Rhodomicrobium TaxID=1068 RepID=UPI0014833E68|nr:MULTISPECIES: phosphodiester glycosidase family protein [Rhodomicrobium]